MRNMLRVAGVVVVLVVCAASATSYRDSFRDTHLGGKQWMVTVKVTNRTGMQTARQYAYQRASEVCGGRGFDVVDGDASTQQRYVANTQRNYYTGTTTTVQNTGAHEVTLVYQCR